MEHHGLKSVVPAWTLLRQSAFAFGFVEVIRRIWRPRTSSDISTKQIHFGRKRDLTNEISWQPRAKSHNPRQSRMISCILLAAGESVRFGSPKALASISGQPALTYILTKLLKTHLSEIVVVLGANAEKINPLIPAHPCIKNIVNKNYHLGQTSSFQTGLEITAPKTRGVMLLPVDMPFITSATIDLLIEVFLTEAPPLLVPTYKGKNGHPPLFSRRLLQEFRDLKTEEPLSNIQHRHVNETRKLEVEDQGILLSFNTPEEFNQLVKRYTSQ